MQLMVILTGLLAIMVTAAGVMLWRTRQRLHQMELEKASSAHLAAQVQELEAELDAEEAARHDAERKLSALHQQLEDMKARQSEREEELKLLETKFENLAHRIFNEKQQQFREQSQKGLELSLKPLRERLGEFEKKVEETYGQHAKEQHYLKKEIGRIIDINKTMSEQAENLTRALKGDVKMQGNWGEIILEKVLESSGLRKGEHYTLQGEGMGLKHVESGRHLKPDVIVHLPENKQLIIDSKVSLTHYERYASEPDETARMVHLKQFTASVRKHVSDLESKRYQDADGLNAPDFVLMFMPIESAYAVAVQADPELHAFAWDKRIYFVSPSTLFPILHTVSSLWRMDMQEKNAVKIAQQGGALYDKIAGFVEDMQKLGKQMDTARNTYDGAMNKLSQGRGNMLTQAEKLRSMGAKSAKQLPESLVEPISELEQESA